VRGCPSCRNTGAIQVLDIEGQLAWGGADGAPTLGEGRTPLVPSRRIGQRLGLRHLLFKLEGANPTGSYKDRYAAATLAAALDLGARRVVVSSTGNLGVSVAAYAAAAGLQCLFLAAEGMPAAAMAQARAHGAHVVLTDPERRQALFEHAALRRGWFPVGLRMPRAVHNAFGVEGYRGIAHEILDALGGAPPDAMLFPCARGNGLYGTWLGFLDRLPPGAPVPRMIACQPDTANSVEVSLARGLDEPVELPPSASVAFSTRERQADGGTLRAIRASGGVGVSASDAEIVAAHAALASEEGHFVEPSSALPVACLPHLLETGAVARDQTVVCVLTAGGARWTEHLRSGPPVPFVEPTPTALDRHLEEAGLAE
jgi:threonine synthase